MPSSALEEILLWILVWPRSTRILPARGLWRQVWFQKPSTLLPSLPVLCCQAQGSALPCSCRPPAPGEELKGGTNQILDFTALWIWPMWQQLLPVWQRGCLCQPGSLGVPCASEELGAAVCRARWHLSWDRTGEAWGLWCCQGEHPLHPGPAFPGKHGWKLGRRWPGGMEQ